MDTKNPFESPHYLVEFAEAETREIEAIIKEFFAQKNLATTVTELNSDCGYHTVKLRLAQPIPSTLRGKVSNVIKNLRDALDQATYSASTIITGKPSNRTHFPFGECPDDLENSLSRKKAVPCKGIPEELFPILRKFEPYPTGDGYEGGNISLRMLGRISGPHKHSVTLQVAGVIAKAGIGPGYIEAGEGGVSLLVPPIWHSANNELEIARVPIGGHLEMNAKISFTVMFGEGLLMGTVAISYLKFVGKTVRTIVERLEKGV